MKKKTREMFGLIVVCGLFVYALLGVPTSTSWSNFHYLTTNLSVIYLSILVFEGKSEIEEVSVKAIASLNIVCLFYNLLAVFGYELFISANKLISTGFFITLMTITYLMLGSTWKKNLNH